MSVTDVPCAKQSSALYSTVNRCTRNNSNMKRKSRKNTTYNTFLDDFIAIVVTIYKNNDPQRSGFMNSYLNNEKIHCTQLIHLHQKKHYFKVTLPSNRDLYFFRTKIKTKLFLEKIW